jgi:hypothetical protein
MLEGLPADHLGLWVLSGWERAIKDARANPRFRALLELWSETGSPMLKAGAKSALKIPAKAGN